MGFDTWLRQQPNLYGSTNLSILDRSKLRIKLENDAKQPVFYLNSIG